jgi:AbrB family looped-hinge helix DNA binding protein
MKSTVTSKFQTTIPKAIREELKISVNDTLEWEVEDGKVLVYPVQKNFLNFRNSILIGKGDIKKDIDRGRALRAEEHK